MSDVAYIAQAKNCDIHAMRGETVKAEFDAKTKAGPWANMCGECFTAYGVGLGTGKGQRLVVGERPADPAPTFTSAVMAMTADEFAALVGDGDVSELF